MVDGWMERQRGDGSEYMLLCVFRTSRRLLLFLSPTYQAVRRLDARLLLGPLGRFLKPGLVLLLLNTYTRTERRKREKNGSQSPAAQACVPQSITPLPLTDTTSTDLHRLAEHDVQQLLVTFLRRCVPVRPRPVGVWCIFTTVIPCRSDGLQSFQRWKHKNACHHEYHR